VAFEELYSRYSHRIGGYVHGMVGDRGRAEDITQEIFIAAVRRMRETDRPINFKAWIYEIAKNACIDSFRRTRRTQEVSLDADHGLSSADRGRLTVVTTPDSAFDSKQALQDLRGAFGGLSESHHEILVLRELEGRSYRDIGERLGMSRAMVESTLFRARRRLAEEYDELVSGRRCEFVRTMVDSGPHYSLGIRDRRRIARHLAHCQPCRAHARAADFDESILNMPSVAARIAALLPIPLLRARWGGVERLGSSHTRPSLLALRSVHTLARSSDQIVASTGAGRSAAAAAAIVLAGVGGGIVSETASQPDKSFYRVAVHASAYPASARAAVRTHSTASPKIVLTRMSVRTTKASVTSARRARTQRARLVADPHVAASVVVPAAPRPQSPAPAPARAPTSAGTRPAPAASGIDGTGHSGAGSAAGPVSEGGSSGAAGTEQPTSGSSLAGTVTSTLGAVTGALPLVPTVEGVATGSTATDPIAGAISGVTAGLGQLIGNP
jgi:RNA polymerase sigma factor (sigma-70 family)